MQIVLPKCEGRSKQLLHDDRSKFVVYFSVCVCVCARACSVAQSCLTLCDPMDCSPPDSSVHAWVTQCKNTGGVCHALLQGIFPTQGLDFSLLYSLH